MKTATENIPCIEERLADLESKFAALRDQVLGHAPIQKDWQASIGIYPDDEISRSAFKFGDEWRHEPTES